jgi:hypothetical protein
MVSFNYAGGYMRRLQYLGLVLLALGLFAATSVANPISLAYGDSYFVGYVVPPEPANQDNEQKYLANLITISAGSSGTIGDYTYDRTDSSIGSLPDPSSYSYIKYESAPTDLLFNSDGSAYILGKYDGPNGGDVLWLISYSAGSEFTIPQKWGPGGKSYGLSHTSIFWTNTDGPGPGPTPVPEPTSLLLLGAGLAGLGIAALRRRAK